MFSKSGPEVGVLEKWSRLLSRSQTRVSSEQLSEEFVSAEELSPWATEVGLGESAKISPQQPLSKPRVEGLIARFGAEIRSAAIAMNVPLLTTLSAASAAVAAIQALRKKDLQYKSLQSHFSK